MTAVRRGTTGRALVLLAGLALALTGCSSDGEGVASLSGDGDGGVEGGYADENTAQYAQCLEKLGLTVRAEPDGVFKGFVSIDGAQYLGDSDMAPIGVDGVDRDAEIKGCRAEHPGAKDMFDSSITVDAPEVVADDAVAAAGIAWAQCARDAGYAMIEDPVVDLVVIPPELTIDQAVALGAACSKPIDKPSDPAPSFDYQAAVEVDGFMDIGPYAQAIESPIYAKITGAEPGSTPAPSADATVEP